MVNKDEYLERTKYVAYTFPVFLFRVTWPPTGSLKRGLTRKVHALHWAKSAEVRWRENKAVRLSRRSFGVKMKSVTEQTNSPASVRLPGRQASRRANWSWAGNSVITWTAAVSCWCSTHFARLNTLPASLSLYNSTTSTQTALCWNRTNELRFVYETVSER